MSASRGGVCDLLQKPEELKLKKDDMVFKCSLQQMKMCGKCTTTCYVVDTPLVLGQTHPTVCYVDVAKRHYPQKSHHLQCVTFVESSTEHSEWDVKDDDGDHGRPNTRAIQQFLAKVIEKIVEVNRVYWGDESSSKTPQ